MGQGRRMVGVGVAGFVLVLGLINGAFAATNSSCTSSLNTLLPCVPYVTTGNTTSPGSDCCNPLSSLLSSDPTCLCQIVSLAQAYSSSINETRALDLASLCKLTVPSSVSSCLNASAPSTSPSINSTPPAPQSDGMALSPFSLVVGSISLVVIYAMLAL